MSLLAQIIDEATAKEVDAIRLLRLCLVLASRLKHEPLKEWVGHELGGYPLNTPLPDYRIFAVQNKGSFIALTWRGELEIPLHVLPETLRNAYKENQCRSSIAECIELIAKREAGATLKRPWPTGAAIKYGSKHLLNAQCTAAWSEISVAAMVSLVEQVKTKVLSFALEINEADPSAGDAVGPMEPPKLRSEQVTQIFNTTINGGTVQNVAMGSTDAHQSIINGIQPGDLASLQMALQAIGVPDEDAQLLEAALAEDSRSARNGIGARVKKWLGEFGRKTSEKATDKGVDSIVATATQAIALYLGLPS